MTAFDVAIVGGGIAGCSAAFHLRRRGASVVLCERGACGSQASGVNYGGVRQQGRHLAELPLARRSRAIWAQLPELIGTSCEFVASGHLRLARSEAEMQELESYADRVLSAGLVLTLIGRETLRREYPWLGSTIVGGSLCAEDGHANPRLLAPAFARTARKMGADIREHAEVVALEGRAGSFGLRTRDGQSIRANRLINTAGAWGATLAERFGERVIESVLAPNMCVTEPIPYFLKPNLGVCGGAIYMRQVARGSVIFGGGIGSADREAGRAYPNPDATMEAAGLAVELVPRLRSASIIRTWSGIEGEMPDGLPILGPSATTAGLTHAFGFSGHGFQLGPAVGAVLAELALDGTTSTSITGLGIDRFQGVIASEPARPPMAVATRAGVGCAEAAMQCSKFNVGQGGA